MVLPLDAMLTSTVAPALRAEGFRRKRRRFVMANDLGDLAVIEVSTIGKLALGDGYRHFWVKPWLLPEPFADLWRSQGAPYPAGPEQGVPLRDVQPSPPFCSTWPGGSYGPTLWAFRDDDPAQATECGRAVVAAVVPVVVATLRRLLERQTLIEEMRRADVLPLPGPDASPLDLGGGDGRAVLPLMADAGDTVAVNRLLRVGHESWLAATRKGNPHATALIAWASARLASRGAPSLEQFLNS